MQNAECRIKNLEGSRARQRFSILHSAFCILHSLFLILLAAPLLANDLSIDKHTMRIDESVAIVVSLEDAFAGVDEVNVPVQNLEIDGPPSVSSEFSWINGVVVRRKVFRFTAHPLQPGRATVGPVRLTGDGGKREVLDAVS
ncbi:MAG: BatD family protein, partial [Thermoanaerobaculia bacterium]